jgi:ribosomal protein L37AE/L43A
MVLPEYVHSMYLYGHVSIDRRRSTKLLNLKYTQRWNASRSFRDFPSVFNVAERTEHLRTGWKFWSCSSCFATFAQRAVLTSSSVPGLQQQIGRHWPFA